MEATTEPETPSYGLAPMLADSLSAPWRPLVIFDALSRLPAPGYPLMIANLAVFTAAFLATNLMHAAASQPAVMDFSPLAFLGGGAALLLAALPASFIGAGLLHLFSRLAGGGGPFRRSYQIVSLSSSLSVIAALLNWIPGLWALPILLGTLVSIIGLEKLHGASRQRACAVFGFLCVLALGGQWLARRELEKLSKASAQMQKSADTLRAISEEMQRAQREAAGAAAPASSLQPVLLGDMPVGGDAPGAEPGSLPLAADSSTSEEELDALLATMDMMLPMLDNPALMRNLPPAQVKRIKELGGAVKDIQAKVRSGKPISQKEMAGLTQQVQQLSLEMMQALPAAMQPPPARGKNQ